MGRLKSTSVQYGFLSRPLNMSYSYDAASNRTTMTDPESGVTSYAYDTLNRLTTLTPPSAISGAFGFGYDALSRRTQLTRPNGVNTNYQYDALSRLTSALHQLNSTTLDGATYTYDAVGNRSSKTANGFTTSFTYDPIYELSTALPSGPGGEHENYGYDAVGNRLTSQSGSYTYDVSNHMLTSPGATYIYDANGNTHIKTTAPPASATTTYAWDFENRLTSVTLPGSGGTVNLKYDPFGRRVEKTSPSGAVTIYAYDGDNAIEELDSSGTATARYAQSLGMDEPLAELRSGTTSFYEADGLGSVTSLSNSAGSVANTYIYDSFGYLYHSTGSVTNPYRFTAREFDSETSLYYYRARYYDPTIGRFLSEDPIQWAGGLNLYRYVKNQPVIVSDPTGLSSRGNKELTCLECTVYAEARGLDSPCQYAVAAVILNRVAEARAKGHRSSVCGVVSSKKSPFKGYGDKNYKGCAVCSVPAKDQADLNDTLHNFTQPFDMVSDALYFGNNTVATERYFIKKLHRTNIAFPACPDLAFYGD